MSERLVDLTNAIGHLTQSMDSMEAAVNCLGVYDDNYVEDIETARNGVSRIVDRLENARSEEE